ncbi:MAG: dihydropteroate synthase, partial [Acidobacteria bacterium]|nr:dihydropteroate synthase [Acidobacteriota bacterium]
YKIPVSVDTYKPKVAQIVLDAGASIINDITGLQKYPQMADIISSFNAGVVLMHMQGSPKNMQENPVYADLLQEIISFLGKSSSIAIKSGISPESIAIDPGIGFGKTVRQSLELLRRLHEFRDALGCPVMVGVSRKAAIGVGLVGITGVRAELAASAREIARRLKAVTDKPVIVGVGIGTPEQAAEAVTDADGVVVGSAVVQTILDGNGPTGVGALVGSFRAAIDG